MSLDLYMVAMIKEAGPLRVGTNSGTRGTNKNSDLGVPDPGFLCLYGRGLVM